VPFFLLKYRPEIALLTTLKIRLKSNEFACFFVYQTLISKSLRNGVTLVGGHKLSDFSIVWQVKRYIFMGLL